MNILMVCLGNICRSPLAEGIMKEKLKTYGLQGIVDSAGTSSYHSGESPDNRSIEIALRNGIDISGQRARGFAPEDFDNFDIIFAMDRENYRNLMEIAKNQTQRQKVELILNRVEQEKNLEVPDPYYGNFADFEKVYNLLNKSCEVIAQSLKTPNHQ